MKKLTYKALKAIMYISRRNKKLVPNDRVKFLIWSLPAIVTCPGACAACKKLCYARKAEKNYPDALPSRRRNLKATKRADFVEIMTDYIHHACKHYAYRDAQKVVFRIHESGDFYSQEYYNNWLEIARRCSDIPNLVFMAYTKSIDFVAAGDEIPANMTIRFSLWDDTEVKGKVYAGTPDQDRETAEKLGLPIYTAVDQFTNEPKKNRCECIDCGTCNKCWSAVKALLCEIH